MKDFGKYFLASVVVISGAVLTAITGDGDYFTGALSVLAFLGFVYLLFK
ncbi:hypothetical protein Q5H92_22780 [Hymenobacter sp. M29]|uniref:Uncharacterized protein n=1 Tax=Hymenobacter mellowenesis TaxID=3063995 RepID=A0ABT9AH66_9BACT|nr:hypothetical protein [Hymenobacter sp. M29]MDO7849207.1 hypothetical protein [Hymenobacter sp. M29]